MKIAFCNLYESLNPILFTARDAPIGDDLLLPFVRVGEEAERRGHVVGTLEELQNSADAIVFIDFPDRGPAYEMLLHAPMPKYLITFENKLIRPQNFADWKLFRRVMTWNDDLVEWNPGRCVKLNYAQEFPTEIPPADDRHFCAMIASNKTSVHLESLYSERIRAFKWFERYQPTKLDLYGPGWQGFTSLWRGAIPPGMKRRMLQSYRFSIVFENAREPGYITEKLFDSMIAGCVPVYLGAPNVERWVPPSCYVDVRHFLYSGSIDYAGLHRYLEEMPHSLWAAKRGATRSWMNSTAAKPFTTEHFAKTVLDTVGG